MAESTSWTPPAPKNLQATASPMPLLTHGGPGRAGDGEEMGGMRGVMHYLQRVALQGHPNTLTAVTGRLRPEQTVQRRSPICSASILKTCALVIR